MQLEDLLLRACEQKVGLGFKTNRADYFRSKLSAVRKNMNPRPEIVIATDKTRPDFILLIRQDIYDAEKAKRKSAKAHPEPEGG